MDDNKIFIVPENDLEAWEIVKLLKENGYKENENLFITGQGWGASWDNLEPEIKDAIREHSQRHEVTEYFSNGYGGGSHQTVIQGKLPEIKTFRDGEQAIGHGYMGPVKELAPDFSNIYGVELQGTSRCNNIDHHIYDGDDRSNNKASIEQVAELIGVELTKEQKFIAANDKGFIPAMEELADYYMMSEAEKNNMIQRIRQMDRQAQGITPEQEQQAIEALKNVRNKGGLKIVELPHSKCATVTDRLYGSYDNLLVICGDGELDFYGKGDICKELQEKFQGWSGGDLETSGFWGGYANPAQVQSLIEAQLDVQQEITLGHPERLWLDNEGHYTIKCEGEVIDKGNLSDISPEKAQKMITKAIQSEADVNANQYCHTPYYEEAVRRTGSVIYDKIEAELLDIVQEHVEKVLGVKLENIAQIQEQHASNVSFGIGRGTEIAGSEPADGLLFEQFLNPENVSMPMSDETKDNVLFEAMYMATYLALQEWNNMAPNEAIQTVSDIKDNETLTQKEKYEKLNELSNADSSIRAALDGMCQEVFKHHSLAQKYYDVLSNVHDNWVVENREKLDDPERADRKWQFAPTEGLPYAEVMKDDLFVRAAIHAVKQTDIPESPALKQLAQDLDGLDQEKELKPKCFGNNMAYLESAKDMDAFSKDMAQYYEDIGLKNIPDANIQKEIIAQSVDKTQEKLQEIIRPKEH